MEHLCEGSEERVIKTSFIKSVREWLEERDAQKKERKEETREGGNRKWIMKRGVDMNEE